MQRDSIHNLAHVENVPTPPIHPTSGDNFIFIADLNEVIDPMALLEAAAFLDDCAVALAAFEQNK